MMHAVPVETTVAQLLPVVCDLHKDKIPNIRLNVAKSLSAAIDVCKAQRCVASGKAFPCCAGGWPC